MQGIEKEITGLEAYLDGLIDKRNRLQMASTLAYDEEKLFVLEKQVEKISNEINEVRKRIQTMMSMLKMQKRDVINEEINVQFHLENISMSHIENTKKEIFLRPKKVFISFSIEDSLYLEELKRQLTPLVLANELSLFDYTDILPGEDSDNRIYHELANTDLILLLISANFIANKDRMLEINKAMDLHESGTAIIIPILISPCIWEDMPFGLLRPLPNKNQFVTNSTDRSFTWLEVVKGIRQAIESSVIEK